MRSLALLGIRSPAFVCGCGHSGTTLVATILAAHPDLYVPLRESDAFLFERWKRFSALLKLRRETLRAGKRYLVEKTPRHVRHLQTIRRLVPGARFVLLVRDGRDVACSLARRLNGNFEAGFNRWVADTGIVLEQREQPDVHVQRYEDIVTDPPAAVAGICDFLGIRYHEEMLSYHTQPRLWYDKPEIVRTSGVGAEHEDLRNWQVNQPIFDGRARWKAELPADYLRRFAEGRAAEIMDAFGYATEQA